MLLREEQEVSYELVKLICKGTKLEGKEYLCVKYKQPGFDTEYQQYTDDSMDFSVPWDRIFAVAIVDDTPIWLEEPFTLYQCEDIRFIDMTFTYRGSDNKLIGNGRARNVKGVPLGNMKVSIPIDKVVWKNFTLTKPNSLKQPRINTDAITTEASVDTEYPPIDRSKPDWWQVGGTHYKNKAIQPWAYMEANFTKEEFVGFLRGNAHKYLDRYKDKNGIEDLKKAIHYIEKLIQIESK